MKVVSAGDIWASSQISILGGMQYGVVYFSYCIFNASGNEIELHFKI